MPAHDNLLLNHKLHAVKKSLTARFLWHLSTLTRETAAVETISVADLPPHSRPLLSEGCYTGWRNSSYQAHVRQLSEATLFMRAEQERRVLKYGTKSSQSHSEQCRSEGEILSESHLLSL